MILSWDDIQGGSIILSILIWVGLTGLFYLVCYMAALNIIDDFTRNKTIKLPIMTFSAFPAAFLMAIFKYSPVVLFILMAVSNFFRVRKFMAPDRKQFKDIEINPMLFYSSSYLYIFLVCGLAIFLQTPVEMNGQAMPYWESLFPQQP